MDFSLLGISVFTTKMVFFWSILSSNKKTSTSLAYKNSHREAFGMEKLILMLNEVFGTEKLIKNVEC